MTLAATRLNIHFRQRGGMKVLTNDGSQKARKVTSLQNLGEIVNPDEFKNKHFKYLDFLKEVHLKTKIISPPGYVSLTEIRNKHGVGPDIIKILFMQGMIKEVTGNKRSPSYVWNTIPPNMYMVQKLMDDMHKQRENTTMVKLPADHSAETITNPPIYLSQEIDYDRIIEAVKASVSPAAIPHIDLNPIITQVKTSVSAAIKDSHRTMMSYIQQALPQMVQNEMQRLNPEIKIVEVEKHTEHHHYVTKEEKGNLINRLFNKS